MITQHFEGSWLVDRVTLHQDSFRPLGDRPELGSAATVKEASQTQLCAYLSIALLIGLVANAAGGLWWADPLAALFIAGVAVKEGRESWRGEGCADGCC